MKSETWAAVGFAAFCLLLGFLVLAEQYLTIGAWFQIQDVHHETIALTLFALGIGIFIGVVSARK